MKKFSKQSDEHLINRFQETNDNRVFSTLIERHEKTIYRKCYGYVKDKTAAEDLCQEVLIKLFLKLKSYQNNARFSTWLFSIIHNTSIDYLRKNKKNVRSVLIEKLSGEVAELVEDKDELSEEVTLKILDNLLDQLTPEDRMLLLMKYKEKHQIKDMQQALGVSESAIKMRLKRARERITKLHQKYKV